MSPGIGDRLKKLAKTAQDAERLLAGGQAVLQGRPPPSLFSTHGTSSAPSAPAAPANPRCAYCGGVVAAGTAKCPSCNAPL